MEHMKNIDKLKKRCGCTNKGDAKYSNGTAVCMNRSYKTDEISGFRSGSGREFNICAVLFAFLLLCGIIGGTVFGVLTGACSADLTEASAASYFAYAYKKSNGAIDAASVEELVATAVSYPVNITGTIHTSKYVLVENGTPRITQKHQYESGNPTIYIYIPEITISKDYSEDAIVNNFVRLVDTPVTNWEIRSNTEIKKGTYRGITLSFYTSNEEASAEVSTAPVKMQIYDGSTWRDIWLPDDSNYNITEEIKQEADPDLTKCQGLSATIKDCSINGITYHTLQENEGIAITVNGAGFTQNARGRFHDVTNWFSNLPLNCSAMVKKNAEVGASTLEILLARKVGDRTSYGYPLSASLEQIKAVIPLGDLVDGNGQQPWAGIDGGVVVNPNQNAVYHIFDRDDYPNQTVPMAASRTIYGTYGKWTDGITEIYKAVGSTETYVYTYLPAAFYDRLPDVSEDSSDGKVFQFSFVPEESDLFTYNGENEITLQGTYFGTVCNGVYRVSGVIDLSKLVAKKPASGEFTVKMLTKSGYVTLEEKYTHIKYEISEQEYAGGNEEDDQGENGEHENHEESGSGGHGGDEDSGSGDDTLPSGEAPDIWVNGKDNKKENIYKKSLIKDVSGLIGSVPEDCKLIVSVTDTVVEDASGAFASGKGKKSNTAKAAYKKAENTIVVTAGKTGGTVRIWVAAIDSNKEIQASGHFDVSVGTAPKKLFVSNYKNADMTSAIKSVAVNAGESVKLYANANGTELSEHAKFTWTVSKDNGCLEITPSANTQSAKITVKSAPADGKLLKAAITVVNVESGKKVNCSIMIGNEVTEISGLSGALTLPSAAEEAVEQKLDYTLVCADGTSFTTDKIKVFTTAALEEGAGFTVTNGRKFTLSSKSKVKVTCKNGEFTLKAAKKTADGTQLRVLVVVTHADKTVEVFESGVITIGEKAE